jgi:hypothetical protein
MKIKEDLMYLGKERIISKEQIILSSIRALGAEMRPHMREISVGIDPKKNTIDIFQNSLYLKKLTVFEQIYCQILRAYAYIWPKNLGIKMPKRSILASQWGFERCLMTMYFYYDRPHTKEEEDYDIEGTITTQIVSDFPFEFDIEEKIIVIPYPEKIHPIGTPIYRRYEP